MNRNEILVNDSIDNERIDKFLSVKLNNFTRSQIQLLCENKKITVNGNFVSKNFKVKLGDTIEVNLENENSLEILPENVDFKIYYQDEFLAIIEKPKGMLLYPTDVQKTGTMANAIVGRFGEKLSTIGGENRPGIVHRLDKDTSGLLIIAFDNTTHSKINGMMVNHEIVRKYKGITYGTPKKSNGIIEAPIGRNQSKRTQMAVIQGGREAKTYYEVIDIFSKFALVEYELFTGRTHQIRVHSAYIGHPIAGDAIYGPKKVITELKGQCLHSYKLEFVHPITNERLSFESELPDYFLSFIKKIDI